MILESLKLKNFRSFGNNENILEFDTEKGNLILLAAPNGSGKSSAMQAIDYTIHGKVKINSKTLKMDSLPNRYNSGLETELNFLSGKDRITVKRKQNPNKLELFINNEPYERAGKSNVQSKIDEYVGFDLESWKSFISLSINDFKDFMSLKPEEKRLLLDKLFNLELINTLTKVLKEKKKQYKHQIDLIDTEIRSYESSLLEFKNSIIKLKNSEELNIETQKEEIKKMISSKKDEYSLLQDKLKKCDTKEVEITQKLRTLQDNISKTNYEIKTYEEKITLFNSGKCPTCGSNLSADTYDSYRSELNQTLTGLKSLIVELKTEYQDFNEKSIKLKKITIETNSLFVELKSYLQNLKQKLESLNIDSNNSSIILQLEESINRIEEKSSQSKNSIVDVKQEDSVLEHLIKLFSNDGIKKSIISKIVVPVNHFIEENLQDLNMNFKVKLDDEFDAKIEVMGEEIEVETLSTGEKRRVNLAILMAYLKLIRLKKHVNILFLDEVFSGVDIDGIYDIIKMLKNFAKEYKINIFLVHHAMLDKSHFDKIIRIEKGITSNIVLEN